MRRASLAICIIVASQPAWSQQKTPTVESLQAEITEWQRASTAMGAELRRLQAQQDAGDFDVIKSFNASMMDHYAYQAELRDHGKNVVLWQLFFAYIMLALVSIVVTLGLVLSLIEVRSGLLASRAAAVASRSVKDMKTPAISALAGNELDNGQEDPVVPGQASATPQVVDTSQCITLNATSLQVTSAITGVIILAISLGFLYLFVDRVLELNPVDLITENTPSVHQTANAQTAPSTE